MWFIILTLTLCVLVSSVEVNKSTDSNLFEDSVNRNCDGDFPWTSTEYKYLGIVPFNDYNKKCIQAISKSCATSHQIDFSRGAIELNVYLRLLFNKSGLKVTVFNENNVLVIDYELSRLKNNYTDGWNKILLHPEESIIGYINLKGCTDKGEIIVVDTYQYFSTKKTQNESAKIKFNVVNENFNVLQLLNKRNESLLNKTTNVSKIYSKKRFIRSVEDTLTTDGEANPDTVATVTQTIKQEPGESVTSTEPTTKELDEGGNTVTSKPLTTEPEEDGNITSTESTTTNATKDPEFNPTDGPEQDNNTKTTESDSSTQEQGNNFWTPLTITLVAVGCFVVLSVTAVTAYHCGKMSSSKGDTDFIIEEDIVPKAIIPRVKNINRFEV
ncbi:jg21716 [Pararge aegeria aegeria]|uniref:Jg21716 protein n=1 Tax=Pararge aegeria aegeria TaxID=348720 RepID=A0A8S4SJG3_9NEOP|nr:jg21716 [Pararge aegeria aegeria]